MHKKILFLLFVAPIIYADTHLDVQITYFVQDELIEKHAQVTIADNESATVINDNDMRVAVSVEQTEENVAIVQTNIDICDEDGNYVRIAQPVVHAAWNEEATIRLGQNESGKVVEELKVSVIASPR